MKQQIKEHITKMQNGEVPEGYKKTKVGIIPDDWEVKRLGEVSDVYDGTHQTPKYTDIGIPFISVEDIKDIYNSDKYISNEDFEKYKIKPQVNDIFMTRITAGIIGDTAKVINNEKIAYYVSLALIRATTELNIDYLIYEINSFEFKHELHKRIIHTAFPKKINLGDITKCNVLLPHLHEQQKIAEILSTEDKVIELKEKVIAEKEQQKKYLMQNLLTGKKRIKGFTGEWKKMKLGEVCNVTTGNKDAQNKVDNGDYPFFIRSEKVERINTFTFNGEAILIPGDGKIGEIYHYIVGKFDFHQRVYMLSGFSNNSGLFLLYYLKHFFKKRALSMTAKATVDSLRREMLTGMPITLPPIDEQNAIAEILSTADQEIELLKADLAEEKQKKKALMQLLLTGIVRV